MLIVKKLWPLLLIRVDRAGVVAQREEAQAEVEEVQVVVIPEEVVLHMKQLDMN
jgi:hypothetical protein